MSRRIPLLSAFAAGVIFAVGLVSSGMVRPSKVQGFLDVAGMWDPSLGFVMAGAIGVHAIAHVFARRRSAPLAAHAFPSYLTRLDGPLLAGAAVFGVGWGLSGYCPGPALISAGAGVREALWFLPAMLAGMWLHARWRALRIKRRHVIGSTALRRSA